MHWPGGINKNQRIKSGGIAALELSLILAITLPALIGAFVVMSYQMEVSAMRNAIDDALQEVDPPSLRLYMGRMDGWLRGRHGPLERDLAPISSEIHSKVLRRLGVHDSSSSQLKVSVSTGFSTYNVDTLYGSITSTAGLGCGVREDDDPDEDPRGGHGWVVTFPAYTPPIGQIREANHLVFQQLWGLGKPCDGVVPTEPSPYAVASGQYGTRLQLHYGQSHTYSARFHPGHSDNRSHRPVNNYLRATMVFAAAVVVDLSDTSLGKVITSLNRLTGGTPGESSRFRLPLRIEQVRLISPRTDL